MARKLNRLSELNDKIGFLVLAAPDKFPIELYGSDHKKTLIDQFAGLREAFHLVEKKIRDPSQLAQLRQLLDDALKAYQQGDRTRDAHFLQDFDNILFPNQFKDYEERKGISDK